MNKPSEKQDGGNTLLMPTASNLYIKMAAPGWPSSCNTAIKFTLAELASQAHVSRYRELYCHAV